MLDYLHTCALRVCLTCVAGCQEKLSVVIKMFRRFSGEISEAEIDPPAKCAHACAQVKGLHTICAVFRLW